MKYSLRTKLSLSYVLMAFLCIGLISAFTNVILEKQFREYIINNQEIKNKEIVNMITQQYNIVGKWDSVSIENIGVSALENGLIVKVKDMTGQTIWDATKHNSGLCNQMLQHIANNMSSRYYNWQGNYVENKYAIKTSFQDVGNVEIGYYGPYYLNDNDLKFINTLNKFFIVTGIFSLILATLLGAIMSKRLSNPISRVIDTALLISKGQYKNKINEKSNTTEICQLISTVNNLSDTLEKQEKLRERLTSDVAHELRTPLATLQSHIEAMIDGIWETSNERLQSCHEEIIRISRMVGDLEKLAQVESENIILNKSQFNIFEIINNMVRNFESEFDKNNIKTYINGQNLTINADGDKITQVIINLLSNALKYTEANGKVTISLSDLGKEIELRVKDTGIGISQEDLPYIFERFYRADKSRNRQTGGAGIGLTITKAIIQAHNGTIEVESKLGEGTEFIIILPKI